MTGYGVWGCIRNILFCTSIEIRTDVDVGVGVWVVPPGSRVDDKLSNLIIFVLADVTISK
jgi:hypothetical protein